MVKFGIGQPLKRVEDEETLYDEDYGQLLSVTLMDYASPRAGYLSNFKFYYNEIACKTNLLGVKGAEEAGTIGVPPAIINAICNALDIEHVDMSAKPEKQWNIITTTN